MIITMGKIQHLIHLLILRLFRAQKKRKSKMKNISNLSMLRKSQKRQMQFHMANKTQTRFNSSETGHRVASSLLVSPGTPYLLKTLVEVAKTCKVAPFSFQTLHLSDNNRTIALCSLRISVTPAPSIHLVPKSTFSRQITTCKNCRLWAK